MIFLLFFYSFFSRWPAEVCHPLHIPDNIERLAHHLGQFAVRFLGTHNWAWLHRGRTYAYQEGDSSCKAATRNKLDKDFRAALDEAAEAYAAFKQVRADLDQKETVHDQIKPSKYRSIKTSVPYGNVTIPRVDPDELPVCECKPDQTDPPPCSSNDECLNRMLMYECHPSTCKAQDKCQNQRFQKKLYPKLDTFKTPLSGWGLKAMEDIKEGEFVQEYVGELIDDAECQRRIKMYQMRNECNFYILTLDSKLSIDAAVLGNCTRLVFQMPLSSKHVFIVLWLVCRSICPEKFLNTKCAESLETTMT